MTMGFFPGNQKWRWCYDVWHCFIKL